MSQEKKHILYLSSWYPSEKHPFLGNFVKRQAELLAQEYYVSVVHTVSSIDHNKVQLVETHNNNMSEYIIYHPLGKNLYQKRRIQREALELALHKVTDVDLLLTQIILPKGWQFIKVKKNYNCPWIHIEQGSYFRPEIREKWTLIEKTIIKRCRKNITAIFAASEFLKKDLKAVFPNRKIEIIPNHVDTGLFSFKDKAKEGENVKFLHISTLDVNTKNPKGMFDACKMVKERKGKSFQLTVISDEPVKEWKKYCANEGLEDIVLFEGAKEWEELPSYYHQSDVFILNSIYETFSIVLAEAWSTGTPTITTPVGIGNELPQNLGLQSKINDSQSLANRMIDYLDNREQFVEEEIREAAMQYSSENVLNQLRTIINKHVG